MFRSLSVRPPRALLLRALPFRTLPLRARLAAVPPALIGRVLGIVTACVVAALIAWPIWLQLTGNFHAVVPGEVYRSAQPAPAELRRWTAEYGIRSVLNLRGGDEDADWYRAEAKTADELGLVLADFPLSARRNPGPERIAELVALMRRLPKPVLIHCKAGADRTGLAAALYLAAIADTGAEAAEGQLSFAYGHVGVPVLSQAWAMNEAWEESEPRLDDLRG